VAVERTELLAQGLKVEGVISAELMYITTDDGIPVETTREIYPFEQWIELPDANDEVRIELATGLEQLSASMLDQEHVEIKAQIKLDLMAFRTCSIPHIEEVREEPLDREQLETLPGIVGYLVREGDDLWTIAKTYRTTEQKILETNGKTDRSVARGEKLLIVKEL
jgi:hypothetical protein